MSSSTFQVGGQAVVEGVMMRTPHYYAVAVRKPSGEIGLQQEKIDSIMIRHPNWNKPLIRGFFGIWDAMTIGLRALNYSANAQLEGEQKKLSSAAFSGSMAFALVAAFVLFVGLPNLSASLLKPLLNNELLVRAADGIFRMIILILYIVLISFYGHIRRVFQYHGAEHRAVSCHEAGQPLTPQDAQKFSSFHPRCGTNLIAIVMLLKFLVFLAVPWGALWLRLLLRVIAMPIMVALSVEIIKAAGARRDSKLLRAAIAPGMWLQRLTTRVPSDDQVEVALEALKSVLVTEEQLAASAAQPAAAPG